MESMRIKFLHIVKLYGSTARPVLSFYSKNHCKVFNRRVNTVRKIPNTYKNDDVTLKRGLVGSTDLFDWLKSVREGTIDRRNVSITLLDEAREPIAVFRLVAAQIKKWTGPTLAAKGGGEVAMEEIQLCHEGIEYQ